MWTSVIVTLKAFKSHQTPALGVIPTMFPITIIIFLPDKILQIFKFSPQFLFEEVDKHGKML